MKIRVHAKENDKQTLKKRKNFHHFFKFLISSLNRNQTNKPSFGPKSPNPTRNSRRHHERMPKLCPTIQKCQ